MRSSLKSASAKFTLTMILLSFATCASAGPTGIAGLFRDSL
jgi:hypothetical protein